MVSTGPAAVHNQLTQIGYPDGLDNATMAYTGTGKLKTLSTSATTWTYVYNLLDLPSGETLGVDGYLWSLGYGYDGNGALSTTVYPDGKVVSYAPDALGRPTQAGSYAAGAAYHPDGSLAQLTFANGTAFTATQNARNLISSFSYKTGSVDVVDEALAYDHNANLTQVVDQTPSAQRDKVFGYDGVNRLTSAGSGLWGTELYTYDSLNNILSIDNGTQVNVYNYGVTTNLLTSISAGSATVVSFIYDPRGNVQQKNAQLFNFDQANHLASITGLDAYTYDGNGRRVKKTSSSGAATYYAYNQAGQLLWQLDPATTNGTDYVYLGSKLVASTVNARSQVLGTIEGVAAGTSAVITGWACSTGLPQSIQVALYLNGPAGSGTGIGTYSANLTSDSSIASSCGSTGSAYRFSIPLTDTQRQTYVGQGIYVHGISPVGNPNNLLANSGTYQVPASLSAPPAPTLLNAAAAGDLGSINLSWSSSITASSYSLQESYNSGAWNTYYNGAATSLNAPVSADGSYLWRVQACSANGCSAYTQSSTIIIAHIPTVPTAISVPATSNGPISIGWSTSTYQTSYSLEQSFNGGGFAAIYSGAANSFSYTATSTGNYAYRVRACNVNGCSGYGATGSATITIPPTQAPNIAVPASSNNGCYTVNWGGFAGMTSYTMQEQVNGGTWTTIANNGSGTLSICGKSNGTYGYRVQGCNAGGCGPWSATATVIVALVPAQPTGAAVVDYFPNSKTEAYKVVWNAVAGATSYEVQAAQSGVLEYSGPALTMLIGSGLQPYHPPYASVNLRACNASGCSAWEYVP